MVALLPGEPVITDQATAADLRARVISIGQAIDRVKWEANGTRWSWHLVARLQDLERQRDVLIGSLRAGMVAGAVDGDRPKA